MTDDRQDPLARWQERLRTKQAENRPKGNLTQKQKTLFALWGGMMLLIIVVVIVAASSGGGSTSEAHPASEAHPYQEAAQAREEHDKEYQKYTEELCATKEHEYACNERKSKEALGERDRPAESSGEAPSYRTENRRVECARYNDHGGCEQYEER